MPTFFRHWGSLGLALAITWGLGACQKNEEGALVPSVSTCPIPTLQGPPLPSLRGWLFDREVNFGPDSLVTAGRVIRKDTVVGLRGRLPLYGAFYSSLTRTTMRANPNPVFPEVLNRVERVGIYTPTTPGGVLPKQFPGVLATLFCPYRHSFKPEPRPAVLLNGFAVEYVSFGPGRPDLEANSAYGPQSPEAYFEVTRTQKTNNGYLVHLRVRCQLYNRQGQPITELRDTELVLPFNNPGLLF